MAANIIEKSNNGLFENEIEFNGRYATIVRHLKEELGLFTTFREAYVTAAIIGYVNKRTESDGSGDKVQSASIFPNELSKRKHDLRFLYRVVMLVEDDPTFTIDDYMNRAFRDDADDGNANNLKQNMSLFNSYVCGGLDFLNEKFGSLDRMDDLVDTLYEMVHNFAVDVEILEDDTLPNFEPIFLNKETRTD